MTGASHKGEADERLLRRLLAGDEAAFAALYGRWQGGVYRFALQMSGSEALAEDVAQETFLTLLRVGGSYSPDRGAVGSWLYGIARNLTLRALREDRATLPLEEDGEEPPAAGDPVARLDQARTVEAVRQAVLSLPAAYREAVVLCDLQELGYAEAAAALDCAVGTVRSRLHRGRALLERKLRSASQPLACGPARDER